jgi:integrase
MAVADNGELVDPSRQTLGDFLDRWERDWVISNVSLKTGERYRELLRCHVRPHLGAVKIQKLKAVNFVGLYGKLLRGEGGTARLPPRTVGHGHRVLHRALGHAVQWNLIQRSPVGGVDPPKVEATEIEILNEDQVSQVTTKLHEHVLYPLVLTALATGMRRGELLALRWRDVDLDGAKIRVEQSLEQTKAAGLRFKSPKTKHCRRTTALPLSVVSELRAHRTAQLELRLKAGIGRPADDTLVFGHWNGEPRSPNSTTKEWMRLVSSLDLP